MREILFRGKTWDGEWEYGSLHIETGETDENGNSKFDYRILGLRGECRYVIPETIGQFTGLTDKNGKKIFEGDIVRCWYHRDGKDDLVTTEQVVFHQGEFVAHSTNGTAKWWVHLPSNNGCKPLDKVYLRAVEVIGNIHDNPELMEG